MLKRDELSNPASCLNMDRGKHGNAEYLSLLRPFNGCMNKIGDSKVIGFGIVENQFGTSVIYDKLLRPEDAERMDLQLVFTGEDVRFGIRLPE